MHCDGIWKGVELQTIHENNVSKDCILMVFRIWNCKEKWKQEWLIVYCDGILNDLEMQTKYWK